FFLLLRHHPPTATLFPYTTLFRPQLISTLRDSMLEKYSGRVAEELRQQLLNKVFRDGQALVQKQGTGSLITMSLDGVDEVRQYIKLIYSKVLTMMIVPVLIFVGMLFL